jgi:hypothetical protein
VKIVLTAVVAVLVTACGSSSGPAKPAAATPSASAASPSPAATPPPGALTSAKLGTALIGVADLPKGYTRDAVTRGTSLAISASDGKCARGFEGVNTVQKKGPLAVFAEARISFSKGTTGPFLRDSVSSYATKAKAARFLAAVHSVFRQCPTFQATNPKTQRVTAVRLSPLDFPHVGDEGVSVSAEVGATNGPSVRFLLVFVRQGQHVAYVAEIANGVADPAVLERAVRAQVKKLATA